MESFQSINFVHDDIFSTCNDNDDEYVYHIWVKYLHLIHYP